MRRDDPASPNGQRPAVDPAVAVAAKLLHGDLDWLPYPTRDALRQVAPDAPGHVLDAAQNAHAALLADIKRRLAALANPTPHEEAHRG